MADVSLEVPRRDYDLSKPKILFDNLVRSERIGSEGEYTDMSLLKEALNTFRDFLQSVLLYNAKIITPNVDTIPIPTYILFSESFSSRQLRHKANFSYPPSTTTPTNTPPNHLFQCDRCSFHSFQRLIPSSVSTIPYFALDHSINGQSLTLVRSIPTTP